MGLLIHELIFNSFVTLKIYLYIMFKSTDVYSNCVLLHNIYASINMGFAHSVQCVANKYEKPSSMELRYNKSPWQQSSKTRADDLKSHL